MRDQRLDRCWGLAWLGLAVAVALHVVDEAAHDFLELWNPVVTALRERFPWVLLPTFTFPVWIGGLAAGVVLLLVLSPAAFHGRAWMRPLSYALATVMVFNALGHLAASAAGGWWAPGVISSPLLLAAAIHLFVQTRASSSRRRAPSPVV